MARIRTIKPDFFADEKISKLKRDVRLLFVGLWVFSDDYGTVRSNAVWIKSNVFPYDEELRVNDVKTWLDALVKARMLEPFEYNGEGFYNIRTFHSHQKVEKPSKPIVPLNEKEKILKEYANSRGIVGEYSVPEVVSSNSNGNGSITPIGGDKFSIYEELEKNKKSIYQFIKQHNPDFIDPYVDFWNLFAQERGMSEVKTVNDQRRKKFKVRIKEKEFNFTEILRKAGQSEFLLTSGKWFGFDWIIENNANYLKVLEGNYDKQQIEKNGSPTDDHKEKTRKATERYKQILATD
jgi:hypothetical protein